MSASAIQWVRALHLSGWLYSGQKINVSIYGTSAPEWMVDDRPHLNVQEPADGGNQSLT